MILNVAVSEVYNLAMLFDTEPDTNPPNGITLLQIDIPPDNVKELVDKYIETGYNVIVTPIVVLKCGLKEKDFSHWAVNGQSATKMDSVEAITSALIALEKRRLEEEGV